MVASGLDSGLSSCLLDGSTLLSIPFYTCIVERDPTFMYPVAPTA